MQSYFTGRPTFPDQQDISLVEFLQRKGMSPDTYLALFPGCLSIRDWQPGQPLPATWEELDDRITMIELPELVELATRLGMQEITTHHFTRGKGMSSDAETYKPDWPAHDPALGDVLPR